MWKFKLHSILICYIELNIISKLKMFVEIKISWEFNYLRMIKKKSFRIGDEFFPLNIWNHIEAWKYNFPVIPKEYLKCDCKIVTVINHKTHKIKRLLQFLKYNIQGDLSFLFSFSFFSWNTETQISHPLVHCL